MRQEAHVKRAPIIRATRADFTQGGKTGAQEGSTARTPTRMERD